MRERVARASINTSAGLVRYVLGRHGGRGADGPCGNERELGATVA